jgi:hypothetical protein
MAFIAVLLSDSPLEKGGSWRMPLIRAACGATAMALVGLLMSRISISIGLAEFAENKGLELTTEVMRTGVYVSLFIAVNIGLLVFVLCMIAAVAERYTAGARCLADQYIDIITRQGPEFCVFFDDSGVASLLVPSQGDVTNAPLLCRGHWQLFPEGTAVVWDYEADEHRCKAGNYGLISSYGNAMIYEGFAQQFSGRADFFGQVRLRTDVRSTVMRFRPAATTVAASVLAPRNWPDALKPSVKREHAI